MLAHFDFIAAQVRLQLVLVDALADVKEGLPAKLRQNFVLQLEEDVLAGCQASVPLGLHCLA